MFQIQIGTIGKTVFRVILIGRMQVDHSSRIRTVHHFADTFHRHPVESQVIDIQPVDTDVLHQPVETFQIIVMPAGNATVHNRCIFQSGYKPGADIILVQMFL